MPYQGCQAGRRFSADLRPQTDSVPQLHPGAPAGPHAPAGARAPAMELPSACSHPCWFLLTLLLGLLLWARRRRAWDPRKCPTDLTGKTVIVTGANSGERGLVAGDCWAAGVVGLRGRAGHGCRAVGPGWPWDPATLLLQLEPGVVAAPCSPGMDKGLGACLWVTA